MTKEEALNIWLPAIRSEIDDFLECQALDMAIKALEEEQLQDDKTKQLLDELSKMSPMVVSLAYIYAVNTIKYGVDVTEKWLTATENAVALERAYNKGYYEALQRLKESEEKA